MLWEFSALGHARLLTRWNMPEPESGQPVDLESLAHFLESSGWVIDLEEYARSPALYEGLVLPDWCRRLPGAWLLVPLLFRARAIGCVLLARSDVHGAINWEDRDLLKTAGLQAAGNWRSTSRIRALVQAQQFEAFNRLSAYVVHDLKNILAQQSLIVSNAEKHIHKPEFVDDVIDTVRNSVARMTRLMEQMRSGRGASAQSVGLQAVLATAVARRAQHRCRSWRPPTKAWWCRPTARGWRPCSATWCRTPRKPPTRRGASRCGCCARTAGAWSRSRTPAAVWTPISSASACSSPSIPPRA
jgi:putative PEP-CTERM system histidine kinase